MLEGNEIGEWRPVQAAFTGRLYCGQVALSCPQEGSGSGGSPRLPNPTVAPGWEQEAGVTRYGPRRPQGHVELVPSPLGSCVQRSGWKPSSWLERRKASKTNLCSNVGGLHVARG